MEEDNPAHLPQNDEVSDIDGLQLVRDINKYLRKALRKIETIQNASERLQENLECENKEELELSVSNQEESEKVKTNGTEVDVCNPLHELDSEELDGLMQQETVSYNKELTLDRSKEVDNVDRGKQSYNETRNKEGNHVEKNKEGVNVERSKQDYNEGRNKEVNHVKKNKEGNNLERSKQVYSEGKNKGLNYVGKNKEGNNMEGSKQDYNEGRNKEVNHGGKNKDVIDVGKNKRGNTVEKNKIQSNEVRIKEKNCVENDKKKNNVRKIEEECTVQKNKKGNDMNSSSDLNTKKSVGSQEDSDSDESDDEEGSDSDESEASKDSERSYDGFVVIPDEDDNEGQPFDFPVSNATSVKPECSNLDLPKTGLIPLPLYYKACITNLPISINISKFTEWLKKYGLSNYEDIVVYTKNTFKTCTICYRKKDDRDDLLLLNNSELEGNQITVRVFVDQTTPHDDLLPVTSTGSLPPSKKRKKN